MWQGYFIVERNNIGAGNWQSLTALFDEMGTSDSDFPAYNNHRRLRLDDDAVIYESLFDPGEVSVEQFKQLLADEFGVAVGSIDHTVGADDYVGFGTVVWEFLYNALERFTVRRFGGNGTWEQSRQECLGYLSVNSAEWEPEG